MKELRIGRRWVSLLFDCLCIGTEFPGVGCCVLGDADFLASFVSSSRPIETKKEDEIQQLRYRSRPLPRHILKSHRVSFVFFTFSFRSRTILISFSRFEVYDGHAIPLGMIYGRPQRRIRVETNWKGESTSTIGRHDGWIGDFLLTMDG